MSDVIPTVVGDAERSNNQLIVKMVDRMSSQALDWNIGQHLIAVGLLPKHLHLSFLGYEKGQSWLAEELFWPVRLVVAVHTGGDWNEIRHISRVTFQATLNG